MKETQLTKQEAREIRRLLKKLGEPVHADLVGELEIVEPHDFIKALSKRVDVRVD